MQKVDEQRFSYGGLACFLALSPLIRGGHPLWVAQWISVGFGSLLVFHFCRGLWKGSLTWVWGLEDLFFLTGLVWILIGTQRPSAPPDAFDSFLILLGCAACFSLARFVSFSGLTLHFVALLGIIASFIVLLGLLQLSGILPHGWWDPPLFLASTFVNHNHFAAFLEVTLPLTCVLWFVGALDPPQRFIMAVTTSLMGIGFVLSCSRGGWISLAVATALVLVWAGWGGKESPWTRKTGLILILTLLAVGFLMSQPMIFSRGVSLLNFQSDPSIQMRRAMWEGTWNLVKENPWLGHGVGSFVFEFTRHRPAGLNWLVNYAHNDYLQLVAESGVVALALLLTAGGLVLRRMTHLARLSETSWKQSLGFGGMVSFLSLAVHSLIDFSWHIPAVVFQFAAAAGAVTGVVSQAETSRLYVTEVDFTFVRSKLARGVLVLLLLGGFAAALRPIASWIMGDAWAFYGELQSQNGNLETAVGSYQKAAAHAPFRARYHTRLGDNLVRRASQFSGKERRETLVKAGDAYRKALALASHDAWSAHALGEVLKALGEFQESDRWLSQAVKLDPQNPLYRKDLAEIKVILGQSVEAAEEFRRTAQLAEPHNFFPWIFGPLDDPKHFVKRGESYFSLGRIEAARTAFAVALQMDANDPEAKTGLAISLLNLGERKQAELWIRQVQDPLLKAKWHSALGHDQFKQGNMAEAGTHVRESLKLDPSNILARHLEFIMASSQAGFLNRKRNMKRLLSLNRSPVFVEKNLSGGSSLVWEPERGNYKRGEKVYEGWGLFGRGAIEETMILPPGKIRFRVRANGTKARGVGPIMVLSWSARPILTTEVKSETWEVYEIQTETKPGEHRLSIRFTNDLKDPATKEDRNLKIEEVEASWEDLS